MDPQSIIITTGNDNQGTVFTTPEGHYVMAVPVEDIGEHGQSIINVPLILTADGNLSAGSIQLDSMEQSTISIEDATAMNNMVLRSPVKKQPSFAPGPQLLFVSDETSGQRLIFTTSGGKLEGPFMIDPQVGGQAQDVSAALANITFSTASNQSTPDLTLAANFIQTGPTIQSIEQTPTVHSIQPKRENVVTFIDDVQPPRAGPLKCETCNIEFTQWSHKRKHDLQHLMDKPYNCSTCQMSFNYELNLQLHQVIHMDVTTWACPICERNFRRLAGYKAHILIHEKEESITCEICGEEFPTQNYLNLHDHKDENEGLDEEVTISYECTICKRLFNKRTDFKDHMKVHSKLQQSLKISQSRKPSVKRRQGNFKCSMCERRFSKPSLLKRHWLTHSGERPYKCTLCSHAFSQKGSLLLHSLLHKGLKPFKCNFCDATFAQRGNLRSHISRTHMMAMPGETLYQCHICSCVFRKIGPLNSHITKLHSNETKKTPEPPEEPKSETTEDATDVLNSDILQQAITQSGLQNPQSKKDEPSRSEIQVIADSRQDGTTMHYQIKVRRLGGVRWHQCMHCTKEFKKPSDLIRHMRIHTHEKPYKCHVCNRGFTVRSTMLVHLHTHGTPKTMECEVCSKKYSSASSLAHHMKSHSNTKTITCEHCQKTFTFTGSGSKGNHQCEELKRLTLERRRKKILENKQLEEKLKDSLPYLQDPLFASERGLVSVNRKKGSAPCRPEDFAERPYVCTKCNCRFKKRSHLRAHEASHDGIKKFLCNDCGKSFSSKPALKHHIVIMHTNSGKSHDCDTCGLSYSTKGCLRRHMLCHGSQKQYFCPYCEKQFAYSSACRQHIRTHAKEVISNSERSKNNLKAAILVSKDPMSQQQTVVELVNAVEQRTVSVINTPGSSFNQLGQPILAKYSLQLQDTLTDKMMISDGLASNAIAEVIPQIINTGVANLQGDLHLNLLQKHGHLLGIGKQPMEDFSLLGDQSGVAQNQGLVPVEAGVFIQGFDGQTLDSTFFTGGIPIQTDPIELGALTKMLASTSASEPVPQEDIAQYCCDLCKKIFMDSESYKLHYLEEHTFECQICNSKFEAQEILDLHLKTMHEKQPLPMKNYKCRYCSAVFRNPRQLQGHKNKLHNKRSLLRPTATLSTGSAKAYPVDILDAMAAKKESVRRLTLEEANNMAKSVRNVTKPSVSESVFLASLKEASERPEVEPIKQPIPILEALGRNSNNCHQCSKSFKKPSDLIRHLRTHTGEKPYVCSTCGNAFAVRSTLVAHWLVHKKSGTSGLPCHICHTSFSTKGSLRVHMRIHTGSKPLKCPHCPSSFRTSGHRKTHIASAHKALAKQEEVPEAENMLPDSLPTIAEEETNIVQEVEEAVSALHTDQDQPESQMSIPINLEPSEFLQLDENLMQQVHSGNFILYPSDTDGFIRFEVFSEIAGQPLIGEIAGGNMETAPPKADVDGKSCTACGKSFNKPSQLVRHMRIHSGEKPFPCTMCDKKFNQKNALNAHNLTHTGLKKYKCDHCDKHFTQAGNLKTHIKRTHRDCT